MGPASQLTRRARDKVLWTCYGSMSVQSLDSRSELLLFLRASKR